MKTYLVATILIVFLFSINGVLAETDGTTYDYYFGLYPYDQQLIGRYGTPPILETEQQKENWNSTLEELSITLKDEFAARYLYPYGDVVTCGSNSEGYFVILFRNTSIDEQLMDEIYTFVGNTATEMNIQDIPVVFGYGDYGRRAMGDTSELVEEQTELMHEYLISGRDITARKSNPVLVAYGEVPEWESTEEFDAWYRKLRSIQVNTREKIYPNANLTSYGTSFSGRIEVGINKELPLNEKVILANDIYSIIDEEARKVNVTDVPVVFTNHEYAVSDVGVVETEPAQNETVEAPANTAPGFSALTLLIIISLIVILRPE